MLYPIKVAVILGYTGYLTVTYTLGFTCLKHCLVLAAYIDNMRSKHFIMMNNLYAHQLTALFLKSQ